MNCETMRSLLLVLVVVVSGCGSEKYPPVSGKVTFDGQPVPKVVVTFTPSGSQANPNPGPYSTGVTDDQGNFTLRTRRDDGGAVPGPHRVGIEYGDREALGNLKFQLNKADEQSKASIEKEIDELKIFFKSRIKVPANAIYQFEVPKAGTSSANFELNSQ